MDIREIKKQIRENGLLKTAEKVIDNIHQNDVYNSFITTDKKKVLKRAEELENKDNKNMNLYGIPVSIKDNIAVKDYKLTCGSNLLKNFRAPYNATVIERLEKEGAIIIGKTNMDEFASGSSGETSAFGATKNPKALKLIPGGSSSGSAAAVAGNFCDLALGSDTGGSIRNPASHCGVIGMKPSYSTVSRYGLIDLAMSFDQIGPIGNNIQDVKLLFNVIKGKDKK